MGSNILITGAAGYIGGSIVGDFLSSESVLLKNSRIFATVRFKEQAQVMSKLNAKVLQLDLLDENAVTGAILQHGIEIVIHCASSLDPNPALHLINALGKQQKASKRQVYFIHTSGLSAFYEKTGWPHGAIKDSGPIFENEEKLVDSFPIRMTDVTVITHAKALDVKSFIVVPSTVYGRGSGEWNQLSVILPVVVKTSIMRQSVSKFSNNTKVAGVHITDLTALYELIVEKILQEESIPSGTKGFYFAIAHDLTWWEILNRLAVALKARGLVSNTETPTWPSAEAAAEALGVPTMFVEVLWDAGSDIVAENGRMIGWNPRWDTGRFLENIDDEIKDVLELGKAKSSLIESLFTNAKG